MHQDPESGLMRANLASRRIEIAEMSTAQLSARNRWRPGNVDRQPTKASNVAKIERTLESDWRELRGRGHHQHSDAAQSDFAASDKIDIVVAQLRRLCRTCSLEFALQVGRVIVHHFYNGDPEAWRARGPKERNLSTRMRQRSLEFYVANGMAAAASASRRGVFAAA